MTVKVKEKKVRTGAPRPVTATNGGALDSVSVIARILDELAMGPKAMGVTELSRALGETKARVYRNLSSLKQYGLVDQEHATERYRLGWKLFQLGERAGLQFDLRLLADPFLKRLRDATGQSALLSVPLNGEALVIAAADDDRDVSITVKPGNRPSPSCSAQGRIALAWSTDAQRDRLMGSKFAASTHHSPIDPAKIRGHLKLIRDRLYDEAPNESLIGVNVVAAPILRAGGELVGTIGIIGSIQDVPSPPQPEQLRLVQGCAAALSSRFGSVDYQERQINIPAELMELASPLLKAASKQTEVLFHQDRRKAPRR
jgi:DNA-binding IclR family transcriptional regulator